MDLTTRCPQCGSTFTASLADLQLRKGYIRCPNCAHIFDGFEAVVATPDEPAAPPDSPSLASDNVPDTTPHVVRQRIGAARTVPRPDDASFSISGDYAGPKRAEPTVARLGVVTSASPQTERPEPALGRFSSDESLAPHVFIEPRPDDSARVQADFLDAEPISTRTIGFYFWGFLALLGLVLLLLQGIYVYRVQLANQFPAMRPALQAACAPLHCRIPYARNINAIQIMNSALQSGQGDAGPPGSAQTMTLRFTLRNTLDKPQEWPTIIFSLLDFSGTVVVRKNITPSGYLSGNSNKKPFAAHAEVVAAVPVTISGVKVSGFKLSKFFP